MAWVDVVARIRFWAPGGPTTINGLPVSDYGSALAFTSEAQANILSALQALYNLSTTARELLDAGTAARDIWLVSVTDHSGSFPGSGTAGINLTDATSFEWMGRDGQIKTDLLGGHIIHELIHAIDGIHDLTDPTTGLPLGSNSRDYNDPVFDLLGLTVQKQNQIFQEMGWGASYWQAGYDAIVNNANRSLLRTDISQSRSEKFGFMTRGLPRDA